MATVNMIEHNNSSNDRDSDRSISAVEHLSDSAIRKRLLSEALQQPATLLPFALFVLAVLDLLGPNYFSGGTFIGTVLEAIVAILSGSLAGGTFLWRYYRRHSEEYTIELQARIQRQELERATAERARRSA